MITDRIGLPIPPPPPPRPTTISNKRLFTINPGRVGVKKNKKTKQKNKKKMGEGHFFKPKFYYLGGREEGGGEGEERESTTSELDLFCSCLFSNLYQTANIVYKINVIKHQQMTYSIICLKLTDKHELLAMSPAVWNVKEILICILL